MSSELDIKSAIDKLWKCDSNIIDLSSNLISLMHSNDICLLIAWDIASILNLNYIPNIAVDSFEYIYLTNDKGDLALKVKLVDKAVVSDKDNVIVCYDDKALCAVYIDGRINSQPKQHKLSHLLVALMIINYHIDSAMLLPPEMRSKRLQSYAHSTELTLEEFKSLINASSLVIKSLGH